MISLQTLKRDLQQYKEIINLLKLLFDRSVIKKTTTAHLPEWSFLIVFDLLFIYFRLLSGL